MAEKTTTGKLVAAAGGIILIISLFLPWYGVSGELANAINQAAQAFGTHATTSINGWKSMDVGDIVMFLVGAAAIVPAALDIFDLELELPVSAGVVILAGGVISLAWAIIRLFDKHGASAKLGLYAAIIGAGTVAVGGYLQNNEESAAYDAAGPGTSPPAGAPPAAAPTAQPGMQPQPQPQPAAPQAPPAAQPPPPAAPPQDTPPQPPPAP